MKKFLLIVLSMTILVATSFADGKINRTLKDKVGMWFNIILLIALLLSADIG
ncbi:MAG: hypothetical protein LE180_01315 [Endomicrobium sp.]|nr:hypothetical protein [Endomicrobium sp.]